MPRPPMVAVIGKKHSGKTTLTVRLCAELHRRGARVMTIKHGSHTFNIDPSTTDTYRHYHEGQAERVAMAAPDKFALIVRWGDELGPEEIAARHMTRCGHRGVRGIQAVAAPEDRSLSSRRTRHTALRSHGCGGTGLSCDRRGRRRFGCDGARDSTRRSGVARCSCRPRGAAHHEGRMNSTRSLPCRTALRRIGSYAPENTACHDCCRAR